MSEVLTDHDAAGALLEGAPMPLWLQVGCLFTGGCEAPLRNAHIVFDASAILYVGTEEAPPQAAVLRPGQCGPDAVLPAHTLLPGLIEAHAHLFLEGGEIDLERRKAYLEKSPEQLLADACERMRKLPSTGVMAVRDAGDRVGVGLALATLRREGKSPGHPYIDSPGAGFYHEGRYGKFMGEPVESHPTPEAAVQARLDAGAERIKLIPTGIINFARGAVTAKPQMSADEVRAFTAAAHARGLQTFAHASGADGIQNAIDGGVDSIEHGFFITRDQISQLRDRNIAWVPTFAPVQVQLDQAARMGWGEDVQAHLRRILDGHARSLVHAVEAGVQVVAGSDAGSCGVAHGLGFLHELELMERAGMGAAALLHSATGASSSRLAYREKIGLIAPGFRPRMILTGHSPLERISNLRREKTLILDGAIWTAGEQADSKLL